MRARATLTTVALLTATAWAGGGSAAAVPTDDVYEVPASGTLVVDGRGYGHGHGMSQHGAQGAALQGLGYREIVGFYYPGTELGSMKGKVRVLITGDTTDDVVVSPARNLRVRDLGSRSTHALPARPAIKRWRLHVVNGRTVVQRLTDRWRPFRPGGKKFLAGDGEFLANRPLTLWTPSGTKRYRGILRAASPNPGSPARDTVNIVPMNGYIKGVIPAEMPASWHPEAVKSQAIAARTYATWSRNQNMNRYYQICDTTACQVYGGLDSEDPRSNQSVASTGREILRYDGAPAFTQFSASSGGWTSASSGGAPYLPAQEDPYDGWHGNAVHTWTKEVKAGVIEKRYPKVGRLVRIRVTKRDGNGEWQGRVDEMVLEGTKGDVRITGDSFRWTAGLRSRWFTIEQAPQARRR